MKRIVKVALLCSSLFLASVAPSLAEEAAKQPAPAAVPAGGQAQSSDEAGGCAADGKCCGSAACTDAKNKAIIISDKYLNGVFTFSIPEMFEPQSPRNTAELNPGGSGI